MPNTIVIYGQCGTGDYYTTWPVCSAETEELADRIIERLVLQSADYYRRFQQWLTLPPLQRVPIERVESADEFKTHMLDRNFQETVGDATIPTTYYKRHIRPGPTAGELEILPNPNALTPVRPITPRCPHIGNYIHYGRTDVEDRCGHDAGHTCDHEPLCGGPCCAEARAQVKASW